MVRGVVGGMRPNGPTSGKVCFSSRAFGIFCVFCAAALLAPSPVRAARMVSVEEAWSRAPVVVQGVLEGRRWLGPEPSKERAGLVVYHVRVEKVWKGRVKTWIEVIERVWPGGPEGCTALRPRPVGPDRRFFLFLRTRPDGRFESAAWSSCGLAKPADRRTQGRLVERQPAGPSEPLPGGTPPPHASASSSAGKRGSGGAKGRSKCGCGTSVRSVLSQESLPVWTVLLVLLAVRGRRRGQNRYSDERR